MNYSQPSRFNRFQKTMSTFGAKPTQEVTYCDCHITIKWNKDLYPKGCFYCYKKNYACCEARQMDILEQAANIKV